MAQVVRHTVRFFLFSFVRFSKSATFVLTGTAALCYDTPTISETTVQRPFKNF